MKKMQVFILQKAIEMNQNVFKCSKAMMEIF